MLAIHSVLFQSLSWSMVSDRTSPEVQYHCTAAWLSLTGTHKQWKLGMHINKWWLTPLHKWWVVESCCQYTRLVIPLLYINCPVCVCVHSRIAQDVSYQIKWTWSCSLVHTRQLMSIILKYWKRLFTTTYCTTEHMWTDYSPLPSSGDSASELLETMVGQMLCGGPQDWEEETSRVGESSM